MLDLKPTLSYKSALKIIDECNLYIDDNKPWELFKDESKKDRLLSLLYDVTQAMLEAYVLLNAFIPESTAKVLKKFNINEFEINTNESFKYKIDGLKFEKTTPLFNRLNISDELKTLNDIANN